MFLLTRGNKSDCDSLTDAEITAVKASAPATPARFYAEECSAIGYGVYITRKSF